MPRDTDAAWRTFRSEIEEGHKGAAYVLPFDPAEAWGARPRQFVCGTVNGCAFEGEIGFRRGRHFSVVEDALFAAAGVAAGDEVAIRITMREQSPRDAAAQPYLPSSWPTDAGHG